MNKLSRRDLRLLISVVSIILAIYLYTIYDNNRLYKELYPIAEEKKEKYFSDMDIDKYDIITQVQSGKSLAFTGRPWGVLRIYMRNKGDASMDSFIGLEYYFVRENKTWVSHDNVAIREPKYINEAYSEYEKNGYELDEKVFMTY